MPCYALIVLRLKSFVGSRRSVQRSFFDVACFGASLDKRLVRKRGTRNCSLTQHAHASRAWFLVNNARVNDLAGTGWEGWGGRPRVQSPKPRAQGFRWPRSPRIRLLAPRGVRARLEARGACGGFVRWCGWTHTTPTQRVCRVPAEARLRTRAADFNELKTRRVPMKHAGVFRQNKTRRVSCCAAGQNEPSWSGDGLECIYNDGRVSRSRGDSSRRCVSSRARQRFLHNACGRVVLEGELLCVRARPAGRVALLADGDQALEGRGGERARLRVSGRGRRASLSAAPGSELEICWLTS